MATLYGAGAYTGSNPIGGGNGYVSPHGYSQATADYVVTSLAQLQSALSAATSGKVIWIPNGVTITWSSTTGAIGTLKAGAVLASNRGQDGVAGGQIKATGNAPSFMTPLIWASSNSVISGLQFVGPGSLTGTGGPRNCAIRGVNSAKRIEVENCSISYFYEGGIYFNGGGMTWNDDGPNGRHWVHYCNIHHVQKHGFGYGVSMEGACSYLVETCIIEHCRHLVMGQAGGVGSYEARYNIFGDADYRAGGTGAWYVNHQVDWHGSAYSCAYSLIHHNTFSANDRNELGQAQEPHTNVGVRGKAMYYCLVYNNWTKKTRNNQSGLFSETVVNSAFTALTNGGDPLGSGYPLSSYNMQVYDNWYGPAAPPGGAPNPQVSTTAATNVERNTATLNGTIVSLGESSSVIVSFDWGLTTSYGNTTSGNLRTSPGNFGESISGLLADTTYHFRAKMIAGGSTYYGSDQQFATSEDVPNPPVVATWPADFILRRSALLTLHLLDMGAASIIQLSFQWGTTAAYGNTTPKHETDSAGIAWGYKLQGLSPATTYHFRAVAEGDGMTSYGVDRQFSTEEELLIPTCITVPAKQIEAEMAVINGRTDGVREDAWPVRVGFRWGLAPDDLSEEYRLDIERPVEPEDFTDFTFSHLLENLTPDTEYFYQAYMVLG